MRIGEPITWTIKMSADGCLGTQIPDLSLLFPNQLKRYEDKPEISTEEVGNHLIGTKQIKIALIGTVSGDIELPEVAVQWWDLKSNQIKEAVLPRKTLHIQSGESVLPPPSSSSMSQSVVQPEKERTKEEESSSQIKEEQPLPLWVWILVGINGCLVIGGGSYYLLKKRASQEAKFDTFNQVKRSLKNACGSNDPKEAEHFLMIWGSYCFPEIKPLNLMTLKKVVKEEAKRPIDDLYDVLYWHTEGWNGEALWESIKSIYPQKKERGREGSQTRKVLEDIYPKD